MKHISLLPLLLAMALLPACSNDGAKKIPAWILDNGSDTDTGSDSDTDTDTDGDPCDNDPAPDQFDPSLCPDQEPVEECVRFVDVASDAASPDGLTWESAFREIQHGIDDARCGAIVNGTCQVWVAKGRYNIYRDSRQQTVRLRPGVQVLGGFDGTETDLDDRDWLGNETILDGRDADEGPCNVFHVVTGCDDAVLDGFTVTGGQARVPHTQIEFADMGGGMLNVEASPMIANCTFESNDAMLKGGGMHNDSSAPIIIDCLFRQNAIYGGSGDAAGLSIYKDVAGEEGPYVSGCVFVENVAVDGNGGGFGSMHASVTLVDSEFYDNSAPWGAALSSECWTDSDQCEVDIEDCSFVGNSSTAGGAAVKTSKYGDYRIRDCEFYDNTGGGLLNISSAPLVESCVFVGNQGEEFGAVYNLASQAQLINCTLYGNTATEPDGAGGAFGSNDGEPCDEVCPGIANSILWSNAPLNVVETEGAVFAVTYSDVQGGWPGEGNIEGDPEFVDTTSDDYHLQPSSPCIDAADGTVAPETDFDGAERYDHPDVANTGLGPPWVDMGSFEFVSHE